MSRFTNKYSSNHVQIHTAHGQTMHLHGPAQKTMKYKYIESNRLELAFSMPLTHNRADQRGRYWDPAPKVFPPGGPVVIFNEQIMPRQQEGNIDFQLRQGPQGKPASHKVHTKL